MTTTRDPRLGVWSEAGKLRRVLVCAPGLAHLRLTPDTCDELLFDDVLWVSQARRDHFDFVAKMRDRDIEVLELLDLLTDVVADPSARAWVLDRKITDALVGPGLTHEIRAWLESLPADKLAEYLIGGVAWFDVPAEMGGAFVRALRDSTDHPFGCHPCPTRSSCATTARGSSTASP
jgi:arginine deiminase